MKKQLIFLFVLVFLMVLSATVCAAEPLSPAIQILRAEVSVVKTGVGQNSVGFAEADFSTVFGEAGAAAITVVSLPPVKAGVLKLGAVDVTPGQLIPREALSALRYLPSGDESARVATFSVKPYGDLYDEAFPCVVYMLEALNFAPQAQDMTLSAMASVPVYTTLSATDPEGDAVRFRILSAPQNGSIRLLDAEGGALVYRADEDATGPDSFTYTATDCYGNLSAVATVTVSTVPNKVGYVYTDLKGSELQYSAVSLAADGVLTGEVIGDEHFFIPTREVSRADFLMMAMKAAGIDANLFASNETSFADKADFTAYQNRYISTAARLGLVVGMETEAGRCFCPMSAITASQAATVFCRIAAMKGDGSADLLMASAHAEDEIAATDYALLASAGIVLPEERLTPLTRADVAKLFASLKGKF